MKNIPGKILSDVSRRQEERFDVDEQAKIIPPNGLGSENCIITNISESGARIFITDESLSTLERFEIYIERLHIIADCKVMWRDECRIGVSFISKTSTSGD